MFSVLKPLLLLSILTGLISCQFSVSSQGSNLGSIISGIATPFLGSIVRHENHLFLNSSYAAVCSDPVYARLYELNADGSVTEGDWKASQIVGSNARYTFNLKSLGLSTEEVNVNYLVKVEGCNGEVYKRPITDFDNNQDIDYKTSIVANIVNVDNLSLTRNLTEVTRSEIKSLMARLSGTTRTAALDSFTNDAGTQTMFTTIFGAPPQVILDSRPEVILSSPLTNLNELQVHPFSVQTFHADPNYSFSYRWKLDGVVKSSNATWNFIPGANSQGSHQIEVYVGKNDGSNNIDTTKPYFYKSFYVTVDNNIMPAAPAISINAATPSPRTVNNIDLDIATGAGLANCDSFSDMAISESATPPGPLTYTLACVDSVTQVETVNFSATDGNKTLYLWVRDSAGNVSLPSTVTLVHDGNAPSIGISGIPALIKGGDTRSFNYAVSDTTSAITADLYYAADGATFSWVKVIDTTATSTSMTFPSDNTVTAKLKIIAVDAAGNTSNLLSSDFAVDSTAPGAPGVTRHSNQYNQNVAVTLTAGSCSSEIHSLLVNEGTQPAVGDSAWQACTTAAGATLYSTDTTQGLHTLKVWAKDQAGNVSTAATSIATYYDSAAPAMSFTTLPVNVQGGTSQNVILSLTELHAAAAQEITYELFDGTSWTDVGTRTISNGPLSSASFTKSVAIPAINTNQAKVRAVYQDLSNRSTLITSGDFTVDSLGPVGNTISINGGLTVTGNKNVLLSFTATDAFNNIEAFCPKYNMTTPPLDADSCWITLASIAETPAQNITISNFPFQIGSIQADYDVRVWYKDSLGNITALSNSGNGTTGVDRYTMTYNPDPPPSISNFIASSTDTPSDPLTTSDTTVPFGFDLFVRWNLTDNLAIPNGNVSLSYTTDDVNYTTIASSLNNAVNGACTLTAGTTGCYKWTAASPVNSYYRVKLVVSDSSSTTIFEVSNPINTGSVKFISGNTSLGIGGAASNAILLGQNEHQYNDYHDAQALVVTKTGYIFYRYHNRGLVYISPEDGILRDLARTTGTAAGDGGSVFSATLRNPVRLAMDYQDNVLIWDYDRIRKINLSTTPWTITTLFGGGADSSDGAAALSANIGTNYTEQITVTPNGRIYFNKGAGIWYYDPSDQTVKRQITLTGVGTDDMVGWRGTFDNVGCPGSNNSFAFNKTNSAFTKIMRRMAATTAAECGSAVQTSPYYNTNFNLTTGMAEAPHPTQTHWSSFKFTGMDGNIYVLNQGRATLTKYNPGTNTFQNVLGSGSNGRCDDGTVATACKVVIMSAFVSEFGKIYFVDLGVLRTVDATTNTVQTVAGQPRNFGVGFNPVSARYSQINFFDMNGDDIYVRNELENQIVKFSLTGGNLALIAGNSSRGTATMAVDAKTTALPNCGWSVPCSFIVDAANNRLYHYTNTGGTVGYINLTTGMWVAQASGLQDGGTRVSYIGINADGLLTYLPSHAGASGNKVTLRVFNQTTNTATHIYGVNSVLTSLSSTICTGAVGTTCTLQHVMDASIQERFKFDASTGNWLITVKGSNQLYTIPSLGGTVASFETMNNPFIAYDFYKSGGDDFVFYCSTTGNLYKRNITTDVETALTLPISSMKCDSGSLFYSSSRNSLIFAYKQNGLYGLAEYLAP